MKSKADAHLERDMESLLSVEPEKKRDVSGVTAHSWSWYIIRGLLVFGSLLLIAALA